MAQERFPDDPAAEVTAGDVAAAMLEMGLLGSLTPVLDDTALEQAVGADAFEDGPVDEEQARFRRCVIGNRASSLPRLLTEKKRVVAADWVRLKSFVLDIA